MLSDDDILWIGTTNGLNRYNTITNQCKVLKYDPDDPKSISGNLIKSIFRDSHGTLWIGTSNNGLNRVIENKADIHFVRYKTDASDPTSISNNFIGFIKEINRKYLITIYGDVYNREKDNFYFQEGYYDDLASEENLQTGPIPGEYWLNNWTGLYRFIPPLKSLTTLLK